MKTRTSNVIFVLTVVALVALFYACYVAPAFGGEPPQTPTEAIKEAVQDADTVVINPPAGQPVLVQTRDAWTPENTAWFLGIAAAVFAGTITPAIVALIMAYSNRKTIQHEAQHSRRQDDRMNAAKLPVVPPGGSNP